jgi:putative integral membrane protein (TIGR02587 family)
VAERAHDFEAKQRHTRRFRVGLARAFGGALFFALPLLMTMEMWSIAAYINPFRLALLLIAFIPILIRLSYHVGFEPTFDFKEDAVDAFVAYAVGFTTAALILLLLNVLHAGMSIDELFDKVALQSVPASIGAMLAQSQLGATGEDRKEEEARRPENSYWNELFLMMTGALFVSLNLVPTEEIERLAYMMTEWHTVAVVLFTLGLMHAFVYVVEFRGQHQRDPASTVWGVFLRYTVAGYALVFLVSLYLLWTLGQTDALSAHQIITTSIVLALPGGVGAAGARLIL